MERGARRPAVFLDRDGTINREVDYLARPEDFELLPGVGPALRALQDAGFVLAVVTNQSGIARGLLDEDTLGEIHGVMARELDAFGVTIDWIGYCPHHPTAGQGYFRARSSLRKPAPGMLLEATARLGLDPERSWCIGDSLRDLEAAAAIGTPGILVRTGKGAAQEPDAPAGTRVVDDLAAAAQLILGGD